MKTAQGRNRFVVIVPRLGIAIKFAKINVFKALKKLLLNPLKAEKGRKLARLKFQLFNSDFQAFKNFRYYLFRGIRNNLNERKFYQQTKHPILQPTYFSFFGLFNIQKASKVPLKNGEGSCWQFFVLVKINNGYHTFQNPDNFCLEKNRIAILDYGDLNVQKTLLQFGDVFYEKFDPDWDYEAYRKKAAEESAAQK